MPGEPQDRIRISGAREHNLRGVDLELPKGRLICFTGVSGSGKSSLAFDTLFAEGQRRYIESLSSYARQFLGQLPKPDVDQITGLSPSISIQQKTSGWNPRSTVGTITQIHDYIRVLYARAGTPNCPQCGRPITAQTREQMIAQVLALPEGTPFLLLAPKVRGQKGEYRDLFEDLIKLGFIRARIDGEVFELSDPPPLDRYHRHDIEIVVDRMTVRPGIRARLAEALDLALAQGEGTAIVSIAAGAATAEAPPSPARRGRKPAGRRTRENRTANGEERTHEAREPLRNSLFADRHSQFTQARDIVLSSAYACTACGIGFEPPSPQMFSFNSPQGMCTHCDGLGTRFDFVPELLVPDPSKNWLVPCVAPLRTKPGRWRRHIFEGVARHVGFDLRTPWKSLSERARRALLYGCGDEHITFEWRTRRGTWKHGGTYEGVVAELHAKYKKSESAFVRRFYEQFMRQTDCPVCRGARLSAQALAVRLPGQDADGKPVEWNIDQACKLPISDALRFFGGLRLEGVRTQIAAEPLKEITARLRFLVEVGLDYLTLDRPAPTLSGGESQRIRLASQIGSGLVGVLYVLDEPSIGLHPRDNRRLLASLQRLRDMGNTVIVVEHDRDTMEAADVIVDFGPGPGVRGGSITAIGDAAQVAASEESVTGAYLAGRREIETPATRRPVPERPAAKTRTRKRIHRP